jgi:hypothetical protein
MKPRCGAVATVAIYMKGAKHRKNVRHVLMPRPTLNCWEKITKLNKDTDKHGLLRYLILNYLCSSVKICVPILLKEERNNGGKT